jgi:ABC-2 type transport system ATP-binding protein
MGFSIELQNLGYSVSPNRFLLDDISLTVPTGAFVALLGENGAGKTTLMDLLVGFKKPTHGKLLVNDKEPAQDPWEQRKTISYLSEKMGLPGDWSVAEFLKFNRYFYPGYSSELESQLLGLFKVNPAQRIFNLSAGEIRRVQVVSSLSINPELVLADEITAVLDIIGRQKFLSFLSELNRTRQTTVILATNILEDLINHISHVALISRGRLSLFKEKEQFLGGEESSQFSKIVAKHLDSL